jgi:hypothetical protein
MKKLFFLSLASCAIMMASCGNKTKEAIALADSDSALMDTSVVAAIAVNGLSEELKITISTLSTQLTKDIRENNTKNIIVGLANLETIYRNLAAASKLEDAKLFGTAIKKLVNNNAEALKACASENTTIGSLVESIINLPTTAETTADLAKDAVTNDIVALASPAIAKGETAVANAEAVAKLIENAPSAAKKAAENAAASISNNTKQAVNDKVDEAKEKANNKAVETINKAKQKINEAAEKSEGIPTAELDRIAEKIRR